MMVSGIGAGWYFAELLDGHRSKSTWTIFILFFALWAALIIEPYLPEDMFGDDR